MDYSKGFEWLAEDPLRALNALKRERIRQGERVLDFSMINPDLPPPRQLLDRLMEATGKGALHRYSVSRGTTKLRGAFSDRYHQKFSVSLDSERQVCVTMGTKDAFVQCLRVNSQPGSIALLPLPSYLAHVSAVRLAGLQPQYYQLHHNEMETLESIVAALDETQASVLILNFPNNPTGQIVSSAFYDALAERVSGRSVLVLNDFTYGELVYGQQAGGSLLEVMDRIPFVAETYSMSKAFGVPGWRIGALVGSEEIVHKVCRLKAHEDYGVFLPVQLAASFALSTDEDLVSETRALYERRASIMHEGLGALGWSGEMPRAGCSLWVQLPESYTDSEAAAQLLLQRCGIAVMPGRLFGPGQDSFVRFALVQPDVNVQEALDCMRKHE